MAGNVIQAQQYLCQNAFGQCQTNGCDADSIVWDNVSVTVVPGFTPGQYEVGAHFPYNLFWWNVTITVAADGSYTVGGDYWASWAPNAGTADNPAIWLVQSGPGPATVDADGQVQITTAPGCGGQGVLLHASVRLYLDSTSAPPNANTKKNDKKQGGDQDDCNGMPRYSAHAMLASLNIEDTPIRYSPPRGPAISFTATYNQREASQAQSFTCSNLGPKWMFNWLSYLTDNPTYSSLSVLVYPSGGGAENYMFTSGATTSAPDPQSQAVLVRTSSTSYEKRFPDGTKQVFDRSDGATSYPRKIFMTRIIDPAGNAATVSYDSSSRITTITDALGQVTTLSYDLPDDPLKITRVTEPFPTGRYASFAYTNGQLTTITDEIGIQSQFHYTVGTDFIDSMTTPYGTSTFSSGESGTNKWIEMTDPLGGKERVEYRDNAPGIAASDPAAVVPGGVTNSGLDVANTFYWDKKTIEMYPPTNGVYDYAKARLTHWLYNGDGSSSGIVASEKAPLERRVWYAYAGQGDTNHAGTTGSPSKIVRTLGDNSTQTWQYEYNSIGKMTKITDPIGRVTSNVYDANNIDLLTVYQRNPTGVSTDPSGAAADKMTRYTYNSLHEPLTITDAAGQVTTFTYNAFGQMLTRKNAKNETTTFVYGGSVPDGYLASITSPPFNNTSAITSFTYDSAKRVRTVTDSDSYTVTTDYDNLDRPTQISYPDGTNQQFQYSQDFGQGLTTILDLTKSKDRRGLWTTRHYNADRQMDSITDPQNRTTLFGWCACGSLSTITDPKNQTTTFNRDLQGRVYQKVFADNTTVSYLYDGQTAPNTVGVSSRLLSVTDAKGQIANFEYNTDDNVRRTYYTTTSGGWLHPGTPIVDNLYDQYQQRITSMTDGIGTTTYAYYPVTASPSLGAGMLKTITGPIANSAINFSYDQLGRVTTRTINGTANSVTWSYDALGRTSTVVNKLGTFTNTYVGVSNRLSKVAYPSGTTANYLYFPNAQDKRLQQIKHLTSRNALVSQFDYTYDAEGQILTWTKNYPGLSPAPQRSDLGYDNADQLLTAPLKNASTNALIKQYTYGYDVASNRISELVASTTTTSTPNNVNEIVSQSGGTNRTLSYDLNGSMLSNGSTKTFEWDGADRLVAINYTGTSNRTELSYDGLNRVAKIVEKTGSTINSTRKIVWCGTEMCEYRDANDSLTLRLYRQGQYSNKAYFYTRDHLGSIRELVSNTESVVGRYDYDPYGRSTSVISSTLPDFNFTGLYRHSASNLDLAVYRAYDPDLGRWLTRDPLQNAEMSQGPHLFGYVQNDPTNAIDLFGLYTELYYRSDQGSSVNGSLIDFGHVILNVNGHFLDHIPGAFQNPDQRSDWQFYQRVQLFLTPEQESELERYVDDLRRRNPDYGPNSYCSLDVAAGLNSAGYRRRVNGLTPFSAWQTATGNQIQWGTFIIPRYHR